MTLLTAHEIGASTIQLYWGISLGIGVVVIVVVAVLLHLILRTAERIRDEAAEVWRVGTLIANNTIHIPLAIRTNQIAGWLLAHAGGIARSTDRIRHAVSGEGGEGQAK